MKKPWPEWVLDHERLIGTIVLVFTIIGMYSAAGVRFDFNFQEYFREDDATRTAYRDQLDTFPSERSEFVVVVADDSLFSDPGIANLNWLFAELSVQPWAAHVQGPFNLPAELFGDYETVYERAGSGGDFSANVYDLLRDIIATNPLVEEQLSFSGGTTILYRIPLQIDYSNDDGRQLVRKKLIQIIESFERSFERIYYSGHSGVRADYAEALKSEQRTYFPIALLVLLVSLLVCLARSRIVILPFICSGVAIVWTIALMAVSGDSFTILSTVTPILVLILGISDSIHVFAHLREASEAGLAGDGAIITSFQHVGRACLLTSVTTAIGFGAFMLTDMPVLIDFGLYTAVGILLNFGVLMVLLPILLHRIPLENAVLAPVPIVARWTSRTTSFLIHNSTKSRATTVVSVLVLIACFAGIAQLKQETKVYQGLAVDSALHRRILTSEKDLGGLLPMGISFSARTEDEFLSGEMLATIDSVQTYLLSKTRTVGSVFSIINVVKALRLAEGREHDEIDWYRIRPEALNQTLENLRQDYPETIGSVINLENRELLIRCRLLDVGSSSFGQFLSELEAFLSSSSTELHWRVAGIPNLALRLSLLVVNYILLTLGVTFLIIFLGFVIWFKSVKSAIVGFIPNVLPLFAILGFLGWASIPLQQSVVVIFSVVFGIAVNDTIHFLSRYARERSMNPETALSVTVRSTAEPILMSSAVIIAGFLVLVLSEFLGFVYLGLLLSIGIMAALFGDLIMLPFLLTATSD